MSIKLSEGALETIMTGGNYKEPIVQILGFKIVGSGANTHYRLMLSDGKHSHSSIILATWLDHKIINGELADYSVVKINLFKMINLNDTAHERERRCMLILGVTVLTPGNEGIKIGNPQSLQVSATSMSQPPINSVMNISYQSSQQPSTDVIRSITNLRPYQNKGVIKIRVMNKSPIRPFSKSEGKLFTIDLCDESGEIEAKVFNDLCDRFYHMIEIGKIYYISGYHIATANKQYSRLKNDYEMSFTNDTVVKECTDASGTVPQIQYNFVPINKIASIKPETIINVIGVCKSYMDIQEIVKKTTGRQMKKREITIVDQTKNGIALNLWGAEAQNFDGSQQPVVVICGAKITEYNNEKSLLKPFSATMRINPDISEANDLKKWYDTKGSRLEFNMSPRPSFTEWITFSDAEERQLGSAKKGNFYNVIGVFNSINAENILYKACPINDCKKKMVDQENGLYKCEKCKREYPNYKYRIIMTGYISDCTGGQDVTVFHEIAEAIIGKNAEEIGNALESDKKAFMDMLENVKYKTFLFKIHAKIGNINGEVKFNSIIISAQSLNYKVANDRFIKEITTATGICKH